MAFERLDYTDRWKEAEEHFEQGLHDVDANDVIYAANKGKMKLERLGSAPEGLEDLWQDLHIMVTLCQDYAREDYREISWQSIQRIAGAVAYFVSPFDLVPDMVPKIGYLDDAAVIRTTLRRTREDLDRYRQWQIERGEELARETQH